MYKNFLVHYGFVIVWHPRHTVACAASGCGASMCQKGPGSSCTARLCCLSSFTTETWGVPQAVFQRLDCFHRRQLRNLMGVRYPDRITNDDLYSRCGSQPLSELVAKRCRSLTGHVLRMSEQSPPCLAMSCYFQVGSR